VHKILLIIPVTHYLHQLNPNPIKRSMPLTSIANTQITIRVASLRESLNFPVYQEQNHRDSDNDTGKAIRDLNPDIGKDFSPKCPDQFWGQPSFLLSGYRSYFRGAKRPGLKVTIHLHLSPRLRMSGAIPLFSVGVDKNNCNFYFNHLFELTRTTVYRWGDNEEDCLI